MRQDIKEIYQPKFYIHWDYETIAADIRKEGFDPIYITDSPGTIYSPHQHPETKLLAFLEGDMEVRVGRQVYPCGIGDKLVIPGHVEHSAIAGSRGCSFFWSEKLS